MSSFTLRDVIAFLLVSLVSAQPGARFLRAMEGRGLIQHDNPDNEARGPCAMSLIRMAEPTTVEEYLDCVGELVNTTDFTVAGSNFDVLHQCWCNHDMHTLMTEFSCCNHPDFSLLCAAECNPDCNSTHAKDCVEKCPAVCLEGDYAPRDICGNCSDCVGVMDCIVEHSKERTNAGDPDHPNLCDDRKFDTSDEYLDWQDCYTDHPMRTHWHRTNAEHHCYCKADLKNAAETHGCCGAHWAGKICNDGCNDFTNICETAEAKQCMEDCKQKCEALHPQNMVEECETHCIDKDSKCEKYKICEPVGPFEHDYICDDGSKPPDNGCCGKNARTGLPVCPGMCDSATSYMLHHGIECQCKGCPTNIEEAKVKFNDTLYNSLWEHGQATLTDIARRHKLDHATAKMNRMMVSRNDEIMQAWMDHPGAIDADFQKKVGEISKKWHDLIEAEAKRQAEFGDETTPPPPPTEAPTPAPVQAKKSEEVKEGGGAPVVVIIIASIGGLLLIFGILVMIYKIRNSSGKNKNNPGVGGGVQPNEGDPNVVVGRPVEPGAAEGAAAGAPVQPSGKGAPDSNEPTKGDAPPQFADAAKEA